MNVMLCFPNENVSPSFTVYCSFKDTSGVTFFAEESDGINENLPLDSLSTFLETGATGATTSSLGVDTLIKRLMKVVINNVTITPTIRPVTK